MSTEIERPQQLRILVANEVAEVVDRLANTVEELGHEVTARATSPEELGARSEDERPDIALVGLHEDSDHALSLIARLVDKSTCPVVAVLQDPDVEFVREAAAAGVFAVADPSQPEGLHGTLQVAMQRYVDHQGREESYRRRASVERAKGILMGRHGIDERAAYELLRGHARRQNRKVVEVAAEVASVHLLFEPPER